MLTTRTIILLVASVFMSFASSACASDNWLVKSLHFSDETLMGIIALDEDTNRYPVKGLERDGEDSLAIRALIGGKELPIKVIASGTTIFSVKAIGEDGTMLDVKAIAKDGSLLDVKATIAPSDGRHLDIRAIDANGNYYPVKAYRTDGAIRDIKGVELPDGSSVGGIDVHADVKAVELRPK